MFYVMCGLTLVLAVPKALTDPTLPWEHEAFILALGALSVAVLLRHTLPPQVLILGTSTNAHVDYFRQLRRRLQPSGVTCLLTARDGLDFPQVFTLACMDCG